MGLLNSGFLIENPTEFIVPLQRLLKVGFGLEKDAAIEEIEVEVEEEETPPQEQEEPDVEGEAEVEEVRDEL